MKKINTQRCARIIIEKLVVILLFMLAVAVFLSGCSHLVKQDATGEGEIVLTLSRNNRGTARTSAFFPLSDHSQSAYLNQLDPTDINPELLPRSVSFVIENIDGYLVRIEGGAYETGEYYSFAESQDQLSIQYILPSGVNYKITLLALGSGETAGEKLLLGAGQANFTITPDEITKVVVPMLSYKYGVGEKQTFSPDSPISVSFYLLGSLIDELFAPSGENNRVYYSPTPPEGSMVEEENYLSPVVTRQDDVLNYECYQFQIQFPDSTQQYFTVSGSEANLIYNTYLKLIPELNTEWQTVVAETGLIEISCAVPDLIFGDSPEMVSLTPGDGSDEVLPASGIIRTIAGEPGVKSYSGDGGPAEEALLYWPSGITVDRWGNIYFADRENDIIRKIDSTGIITTVAGDGLSGYGGDGGLAVNAQLYKPQGVVVDGSGNLYIADTTNDVIRKVDTEGYISTVAGNNFAGYNGDDINALNARLNSPTDVAVDTEGNLYISDTANKRIRKVDNSGIITTLAQMNRPYGIALDRWGDLYVADHMDNQVKKIDTITAEVTVVAGGENDGVVLADPQDVVVDIDGNILIADCDHRKIRKLNITTGQISTLAGNGQWGSSGDGVPALEAQLSDMLRITVDADNNIYIADTYNSIIRKVEY